jgi:hypothetical protein
MWSHDALRKAAAEMSGGEALEKVQMPILELVGWDSDEGLVELAKFEGIHRVDLLQDVATRARGVDSNWQIPNQALTTNVHQIFNANGFDGLGQTIGIFDDTQKGCRIWDEHEAFANVDGGGVFHTELTSLSCITDSDCSVCSTAANPGHCVGPYNGSPRSATNQGFCVSEHATYVASRASAYQNCQGRALPPGGTECELNGAATAGEPFLDVGSSDYMASRARFVFRNDTTPSSATAFAQAYDTFLQDGASLVVETFGKQSGGYSEQDLVGDWYARHRGLTIVRSARNPPATNPPSPPYETGCYGLNTVCVGGFQLKAGTTGAAARDVQQFEIWNGSYWENPRTSNSAIFGSTCTNDADCGAFGECKDQHLGLGRCGPAASVLEVSKPDVVALASPAHVAKIDGAANGPTNFEWTIADGNSYSAPVVGAMVALYRQLCGAGGPQADRAAILLAGYRTPLLEQRYTAASLVYARRGSGGPVCDAGDLGNPLHPDYGRFFGFPNAEATHGCDYATGVGALSAGPLAALCGGIPPPGTPGSDPNGEGTDPRIDPEDRDGPASDLYGPETWNLAVPHPDGSRRQSFAMTVTPGSGTDLSSSQWSFLDDLSAEDYRENGFALSARSRTAPGARVFARPLGPYPAGDHLRAVMVFDGCPSAVGANPKNLGTANNFDLALTGFPADGGPEEVIFISESLHDTKEGMMVRFPKDYTNVYLLMIWPDPLTACPDQSGVPRQEERVLVEVKDWP